jgi:hypothetical protein
MTRWNGTIVECCYAVSFMLTVAYAEFRIFALYAECHNAECRHTGCRYAKFRIVALYAECHHTECRYTGCCGAVKKTWNNEVKNLLLHRKVL